MQPPAAVILTQVRTGWWHRGPAGQHHAALLLGSQPGLELGGRSRHRDNLPSLRCSAHTACLASGRVSWFAHTALLRLAILRGRPHLHRHQTRAQQVRSQHSMAVQNMSLQLQAQTRLRAPVPGRASLMLHVIAKSVQRMRSRLQHVKAGQCSH